MNMAIKEHYSVAKNIDNQCTPIKGPDLLNQDSTGVDLH